MFHDHGKHTNPCLNMHKACINMHSLSSIPHHGTVLVYTWSLAAIFGHNVAMVAKLPVVLLHCEHVTNKSCQQFVRILEPDYFTKQNLYIYTKGFAHSAGNSQNWFQKNGLCMTVGSERSFSPPCTIDHIKQPTPLKTEGIY